MKRGTRRARILPALLLLSVGLLAPFRLSAAGWGRELMRQREQTDQIERAREIVAQWPENSRLLALRLINELGAPDEALGRGLIWRGGVWQRLIVYAERRGSSYPGLLSCALRYRVAAAKRPALEAFGRGVYYDDSSDDLIAVSDGLEANYLALNLADEIIQGLRGVEEARTFYDRTLKRYEAGAVSPYMTGFLFAPQARRSEPP